MPSAKGDCYEAAGRFLLDAGLRDRKEADAWVLVHAMVRGQGELEGQVIGHAWLEHPASGAALDVSNGKRLSIPTQLYRLVGHVDEIGRERRYTRDEMLVHIGRDHHWGPWEEF